MDLRVSRAVMEAIAHEVERAVLHECCGLLLGRDGTITHAVPAANVAAQPSCRFEIDPQVLIDGHRAARAGGPQVVGYYHSHPGGLAAPSLTDRAMAAGDGRVWAIAGIGGVTFWRDEETGFAPLSYGVDDR